jgi:hypothetical protein
MTNESHFEWHDEYERTGFRHSKILKGVRDDIHIIGIPTGRKADRLIEGFVIRSGKPSVFPVGYVSLAWWSEAFEFDESVSIKLVEK